MITVSHSIVPLIVNFVNNGILSFKGLSILHKESLCPLLFPEACENLFADDKGAFYQHAVCGQQTDLLLPAHGFQLVLQSQLTVFHAAGVEKTLEGQAALLDPGSQLFLCGILLYNMAILKFNVVGFQPFFFFFSCTAFWVLNK